MGPGTWVKKGRLQGGGGGGGGEAGGLGPASRYHIHCTRLSWLGLCLGASHWGPCRLGPLPSRTEAPALTRELYSLSLVTGQLLPGLLLFLSSPARGGGPKGLPVNFL